MTDRDLASGITETTEVQTPAGVPENGPAGAETAAGGQQPGDGPENPATKPVRIRPSVLTDGGAEAVPAGAAPEETAAPAAQKAAPAAQAAEAPQEKPADPPGAQQAQPVQPAQPVQNAPEEEEEDEEDAFRIPFGRIFAVLLFLLVLAGCGGYAYKAQQYENRFFERTSINGVDVSGMSASQAENIFAEKAENYTVDVVFRDGSTETLTGEEMGFGYVSDGSAARYLASQDKWQWIYGYLEDRAYTMAESFTYDDAQLEAAVRRLPELQATRMKAPKDAYIEQKDNGFVIVPEEEGETVNPDVVVEAVRAQVQQDALRISGEAVNTDRKEGEVQKAAAVINVAELENAYAEPAVRSDNEELNKQVNKLNKYLAASITYVLPDGEKRVLDAETTIGWLSKDKDGKPYKDDKVWNEKVVAFVDQLYDDTNTMGRSRKFHATGIGEVTIKGGDYGYQMDYYAEIEQLKQELKDGKKVEREPVYWNWEYPGHSQDNDGIGDDYIEVNLSAQMVYVYHDGKQVVSSPCVSGTTSNGHGTPTGIYGIMFKKKDATLTGDIQSNGRPEYSTKVGYWMPFYDGCGFHDAWWRSAFGGTIYKNSGSHGCVNMPVDQAAKMYEYVEPRMPVILYY